MSDPTLFIVGTPIGNLSDWSPRAQQVLGAVGAIACEDTRRTGGLLSKHNIANPGFIVMNEHTEREAATRLVAKLSEGRDVAIVSDAGMPVISDPGAIAVAAAVEAGFDVVVVPGPSAVSAAVAISGFGSGRYVFEGFLPRKGREREQRIEELATERRIIVLYEAPHRIERTLADLATRLSPHRGCVVARELTKMHEQVWRGVLGEAAAAHADPRGEYVIVVDAAAPAPEASDADLESALRDAMETGLSRRDAIAQVVAATGAARNRVYDLATKL